ncbi:unnamed protein product [Closterium sp. NIES-65]|nr:unnamed protein product [Closterium sp. NIES-65]
MESSVHTHAPPSRGRQAVLECRAEVIVLLLEWRRLKEERGATSGGKDKGKWQARVFASHFRAPPPSPTLPPLPIPPLPLPPPEHLTPDPSTIHTFVASSSPATYCALLTSLPTLPLLPFCPSAPPLPFPFCPSAPHYPSPSAPLPPLPFPFCPSAPHYPSPSAPLSTHYPSPSSPLPLCPPTTLPLLPLFPSAPPLPFPFCPSSPLPPHYPSSSAPLPLCPPTTLPLPPPHPPPPLPHSHLHGLIIASRPVLALIGEQLALPDWVVQLRVRIAHLQGRQVR